MKKTKFLNTLYSPIFKMFFAMLALLAAAIPAHAFDDSGYKIVGNSSIKFTIGERRADGGWLVSMVVASNNDDECFELLNSRGLWPRICEKVVKDAAGPQMFSGYVYGRPDEFVFTGQLNNETNDLQIHTIVLLDDAGNVASVATKNTTTNSIGYVLLRGSKTAYEAVVANVKSVNAVFDGKVVKSLLTLGDVDRNGERSVKLTAKFFGGFCEIDFDTRQGWLNLCDSAAKDGDLSFEGKLKNLASEPHTYVGLITARQTGSEFYMVVSKVRANSAVVGLSKRGAFTQRENPQNIVFDGQSNDANLTSIDLTAHDWRIVAEQEPNMGAQMEVSFTKAGDDAYTGQIVTWFGDNPTGYCPNTKAMARICEAIDKDGPLAMLFGIDKFSPGYFRYQGAATVQPGLGIQWRPFIIDIAQGSSIPDWGDEEADALYIRILELGVSPGGEAVAWLKLVPLNGQIRMVDNNRQLSSELVEPPIPPAPAPQPKPPAPQPPAPAPNPTEPDQPNGSTFCEALGSTYSQIGSIDEQNRARQLLLNDARFGTWKLPTSQLGCDAAAEIFSNGGIKGF